MYFFLVSTFKSLYTLLEMILTTILVKQFILFLLESKCTHYIFAYFVYLVNVYYLILLVFVIFLVINIVQSPQK